MNPDSAFWKLGVLSPFHLWVGAGCNKPCISKAAENGNDLHGRQEGICQSVISAEEREAWKTAGEHREETSGLRHIWETKA